MNLIVSDKIKSPFFVCFIGIDGSGKTTLVNGLREALKHKGIESIYAWNGFEPHLLRPFIWLARRLFFKDKDPQESYSEYASIKTGLFKHCLLARLYESFFLFDYFFQTQLRIGVPLVIQRKSIICDRYIYDTIVNLAIDLSYSDAKRRRVINRLLRLLPKPDLTIFVDIPAEVAYMRKSEFSLDLRKQRQAIYLSIAKEWDVIRIDGNQKLADIKALLLNMISKELGL